MGVVMKNVDFPYTLTKALALKKILAYNLLPQVNDELDIGAFLIDWTVTIHRNQNWRRYHRPVKIMIPIVPKKLEIYFTYIIQPIDKPQSPCDSAVPKNLAFGN